MRKKKLFTRLTSLLCCAALLFGLAACETNNPNPLPSDEVPTETDTQSPNPETPVFDTDDPWLLAAGQYEADYDNMTDMYAAGRELNIRLAEEGDVLMKNDGVFPLATTQGSGEETVRTGISVIGYNAKSLLNGVGSGAGSPGQYGPIDSDGNYVGGTIAVTGLHDALTMAGYRVNPVLKDFYATYPGTEGVDKETIIVENRYGQFDNSNYYEPALERIAPQNVIDSYSEYGDAAVVVLSRVGGEDAELEYSGADINKDKHDLELFDGERELITHVKKYFDKVIVLINASNALELGALDEESTADNLGVNAILWIGGPSNDGAIAIGEILNGSVNPSGRLADTYAADATMSPSFQNVGNLSQHDEDYYYYVDGERQDRYSIEYREGIYVGYRYYEKKYDTMNEKEPGSGTAWYDEAIVYPFGFGLSYTTFDWELVDTPATGSITEAAQEIELKVKVTNTGDYSGKDVVELYSNPPYKTGGIEKATANLVQFAKTKELKPGESQVVSLKVVAQDLASFDWNDKNENGFKGYELEDGDYILSLRKNSHDEVLRVTYTVSSTIQCKTDYTTGAEIKALFSGEEEGLERYKSTNEALENNLMSRVDMELPATSTKEDRATTASYIASLNDEIDYFSYKDDESDPWYVQEVPENWTQADAENWVSMNGPTPEDSMGGRTFINMYRDGHTTTEIQLSEMAGIPYTEPTLDADGFLVAAEDEGRIPIYNVPSSH